MQVIEADRHVLDLEARINDPFFTSKVYCCLGFGNTPESLGELAATKDNLFCAILNIAKKVSIEMTPQPPSSPESVYRSEKNTLTKKKNGEKDDELFGLHPSSPPAEKIKSKIAKNKNEKKDSEQHILNEVASSPLVAAMRAATSTSNNKSPVRKICLLDVLWEEKKQEDSLHDQENSSIQDKRHQKPDVKGGKKNKDDANEQKLEQKGVGKRVGSPIAPGSKKEKDKKQGGGISYKDIAEALITTCNNLTQQAQLFRKMNANTCFLDVPDAIPKEVPDKK